MASLMNGLSTLGAGVATSAGNALDLMQKTDAAQSLQRGQQQFLGGENALNRSAAVDLENQKASLAQQAATLADSLATARESAGRTQAAGIASSALTQSDALLSARESAGRQEAAALNAVAPTPEIKSAQQFAKLSPEEKQAFREEAMTKAGLPAWMIGGTESPSPPTGAPAALDTGAATPAPATAPATAGGGSDRNAKALDGMPGAASSIVKGMVDGRIAPPSSMALAKPYWQGMISKAAEYDPTFDQTTWAGRVATRKSFTAGQDATAVTALNTALGHASKLADQFTELNNSGGLATPLNMVVNPVERFFGDQRQTNTQQTIDALASEARKVFAATGGGNLTELQEWQKSFPLNGSQAQQRGALTNFVELLDSRLQSLAEKYNRGMGRADDPMTLLQPNARAAFEKLTGKQPENSVGLQMGTPPGAPAAASGPAMLRYDADGNRVQ